ncbi:MAG: hypothetical protein IJU96_03575 [Clostridia bacterium]|nr:hypothetical protein [Clostridia bacterium]
MNELVKALEPLLGDIEHTLVSVNGSTFLLIAAPYTQMAQPPEGYAFIDRYYIASNHIYFVKKQLVAELQTAGFATLDCPYPYKYLAAAAGFGVPLRSTLIAHPKFGTRFAMEVIGVKGVYAETIDESVLRERPPLHPFCEKCGKCVAVCPQGALNEGGFDPLRCTRSRQEKCDFPTAESSRNMGVNLWGCDLCQRVCPLNAKLPETPLTEEEKALLDFDALLAAFTAGKKGMEPYRDILGGNYMRPVKLLSLLFRVLANTGKAEQYREAALPYLDHPDERLRDAAEYLWNRPDLSGNEK